MPNDERVWSRAQGSIGRRGPPSGPRPPGRGGRLAAALLCLALAACRSDPPGGGAPTPTPAAEGPRTAVVGFTASLTGKLNVESTRQTNGLKLWIDQVNAAGGVKLRDGAAVRLETRFYDDESNKDRVQELYTRLATVDNARFLVSPYSSGLADAAAVIAEQYGRLMISTGAASDSTFRKGYGLVYQTYTPASGYLTGAIDILRKVAPEVKRIALVYENDKLSTDVNAALKAYAEAQGYEVALSEGYDSGTADFAPFLNKVRAAQPGAILGGGHFEDGCTFAKQIHEKRLSAKLVALLVAPPEPSFAELGEAAVGVIGPSQWEPLASHSPDSPGAEGAAWAGPTGAEFLGAYEARFGEEPSYHAAGGYAAGLVLQRAIEQAGSLESREVKAALDAMDVSTFFGRIRFETDPKAHGLQVGHSMTYVQWQKDPSGKLAKHVIWPPAVATAPPALYSPR